MSSQAAEKITPGRIIRFRPRKNKPTPEKGNRFKDAFKNARHFDHALFFLLIFIIGFGLIIMYSASEMHSLNMTQGSTTGYFFKHQIKSVILGSFFMAYAYFFLDYKKLMGWRAWIAYFIGFILLLALRIPKLGISGNGATRWLNLGVTQVQPAEIIKLAIIILGAYLITVAGRSIEKNKILFRILLVCGIIPALGIRLISDNLSTALIVLMIVLLMTFIANPSNKIYLILMIIGIAICVGVFIYSNAAGGASDNFRFNRIAVWLHPEENDTELGYQTMGALRAIGSGGIFGKGLGKSLQKTGVLPEAENDMVFAVICEELGIFGAILVIVLFVMLLWRLYVIAKKAPDRFSMLFTMGVFFHIAIQVIFNIAVTTNLMPNTGVTLPFISYGGSSAAIMMFEFGIVLNISRHIKQE